MTSATDRFQRRKLLRILHDQDTSRREVLRALQGVQGLDGWLRMEALRAGLHPDKLDTTLARLGMRWASHAVKRFFLSPPETQRARRERLEQVLEGAETPVLQHRQEQEAA